MRSRDPDILLASEVIPPPEVGGQAASRLARDHQERAGAVAVQHGGAILLRVGRGCVIRFGEVSGALEAVADLLAAPTSGGSSRARLRLSLHQGALDAGRVPLADPLVVTARQLLGQAGPGEVLLSAGLSHAARERGLQTMPISAPAEPATTQGGTRGEPVAHRLLGRPPRSTDLASRPLPGWRLGVAVAVATLAVVGAMVATFLSS